MNKNKKKIYFWVILLLIPTIKIFAFNTEEVVVSATSFYIIQSDSIFKKRYDNLSLRFEKNEDLNLILNDALKLNDEAGEKENFEVLALNNFLLGKIFKKVDNYRRAKDYFKKALFFLESRYNSLYSDTNIISQDVILYNDILLNLGSNYQRISKIDSALFYYDKILLSQSLTNEILAIKAKSYANISTIYYGRIDYEKAKEYVTKAIKIHKELNDKMSTSASLNNLANIYLKEENYEEARETYEEAINLIKFQSNELAIRHKEDLYFNYAYTLYKLQDYQAYTYQELSYDIKDSIRERGFRKALEEIYAINNVDKVKKEEAVKRAEATKKMWLIVFSSGTLIIALLFLIGYFRLRQRNLSLKLKQTELIQNQKIERLRSISQKRILNATIDGKESERKEIAETLHDSVSALLSSANLHLQASKRQFNGSTPIEIDKSQKIISEASQKIRNLSHNLVSSVLLKFGLRYAVIDMAKKYSNSQINFEANVSEVSRFNQNFEIKIHNIIQELVNNILKHSNASKAEIKIKETNNKLFISISDNGKGFLIKDIEEKDGLGINQIEARIQMMNGKFIVNSSPNQGTKIDIELPTEELESVIRA